MSLTTQGLLAACKVIRETHPHMTPLQLYTLFAVAYNDGGRLSQTDIALIFDLDMSSVVKATSKLSSYSGKRGEGLGLIDIAVDPDDRRHRIITLTRAGREVVRRLERALGGVEGGINAKATG